MKKNKIELENEYKKINEFVEVEAFIICSAKGCSSSLYEWDEDEVAKSAYNGGWKVTRYNIYCPDCAQKKLKRK